MIVLVGKSCSGKTTIAKELEKLGYSLIVTYTTRPIREGEEDGVDYKFITKEEFLEKNTNGFFFESTSYKVADGDIWWYGTAVEDLDSEKAVIMNPCGLKKMKHLGSMHPVSFYIMANEGVRWNRLRDRGDNATEARRRLNADDIDFMGIDTIIDFAFRSDAGIGADELAKLISDLHERMTKGKDYGTEKEHI